MHPPPDAQLSLGPHRDQLGLSSHPSSYTPPHDGSTLHSAIAAAFDW